MNPLKHRWSAAVVLASIAVMTAGTIPGAGAASAPAATPAADCGPGSRPEPGLQGRAPADDEDRTKGYRCNMELVSRYGNQG